MKTKKSRPRQKNPRTRVVRILNCNPSRNRQADWLAADAAGVGILRFDAPVPKSKDLRDDGWWKVGDQGSSGSCVGWAAADSVIRWHFAKEGRIGRSELLSVRFTWMASKEIDEFSMRPTTFIDGAGTSLKSALDVA